MKARVVLPAIGFLVAGLAAAGVAAWATSGSSEQTFPIDQAVFLTDQTGAKSFSFFLNLTPSDQNQVVKVEFLYNTSAEQWQPGTGGTAITTELYVDGKRAAAFRKWVEEPQRFFSLRFLRTAREPTIPIPSGHPVTARVDVKSEPVPGPQDDWTVRYHAIHWKVEREVAPLWWLVWSLAGAGAVAASAWAAWARRASGRPLPPEPE
jgi:hypothetical protein